VRGKKVLHIAPEAELKRWFFAEGVQLQVDYLTLDASGEAGCLCPRSSE